MELLGINIFVLIIVLLVVLTLFAGVKTVRRATIGRWSGSAATPARWCPAST